MRIASPLERTSGEQGSSRSATTRTNPPAPRPFSDRAQCTRPELVLEPVDRGSVNYANDTSLPREFSDAEGADRDYNQSR